VFNGGHWIAVTVWVVLVVACLSAVWYTLYKKRR
jgi:hypothetical protein